MKRSLNLFLFQLLCLPLSAQFISVEDAVDIALEKNYDIKVQRAISASAANDYRFSKGVFLPQVNASVALTSNYGYTNNLSFPSPTNPAPEPVISHGVHSTAKTANVNFFWPVFDGTRMFATRKRVEQIAELGEENVKNQMMNSVAAVITNYYNIVRQKQQLKALQELIAVNEERVKLAEKKLQVGTGGRPELLQAKVDYNAYRIQALQQETLIQQLKDQLNGLVGMGLPPTYEIADTIPINLDITEEEIIREFENSSPTLLAAKKNIEIANTAVWENKASRSPILNLTSNLPALNYNDVAVQVTPVAQHYTHQYNFNYGANLSIPILNGLNVSRLVSQAKINLERYKVVYEQQKAFAIVGIRNAFVSYDYAKRALDIEQENILLAKENVFIALESFKRGVATYIELRTAQQTLAETFYQLFLARYNAKAAETELLRLKGDLLK